MPEETSLKKFVVALDDPGYTYSPGEIVKGKIYIDLRRPKTVRGIKIRIKGTTEVRWHEENGNGSDKRDVTYSGEEEYFRMEYYVLGNAYGVNTELEAGSHIYPFEFCLPRNIPSSFETINGSVRYSIKASIQRPRKLSHEKSILFTVLTPFDLSQCQAALIPIIDEEFDTICCFSIFNAGVLKIRTFLPASGFAIGEAIQATININNTSRSVDVEKIKLELIQKVSLFSQKMDTIFENKPLSTPYSRTKVNTQIVQHTKKMGPFNKTDEVVVSMQVPSLPYSDLTHCRLMDINYRLKVIIVVSGCHLDIEKKYPVTIGSRPVPAHQTPMNSVTIPALMPNAPFISDESPVPVSAMPMPMPTDTMSMPMPTDTMPMPMPTDTMSMPMPTPYLPSYGEKITEKSSNEFNPPAPGFPSAITNLGFVPVNTPYPTGNTPYPTGKTPYPTGNTPYPTGDTPYPTSKTPYPAGDTPNPTGNTPYPTGNTPNPTGNTSYPTGNTPNPTGNTPYPTGNTPYPTGNTPNPTGNTPYPTGNTPYPTGNTPNPTGNTPYPTDNTPNPTGNTPYPTGNTPYPTGNTPYPTGNTPYPPAKPDGFVGPDPAETSLSTAPTAPPSYDDAVGMGENH